MNGAAATTTVPVDGVEAEVEGFVVLVVLVLGECARLPIGAGFAVVDGALLEHAVAVTRMQSAASADSNRRDITAVCNMG